MSGTGGYQPGGIAITGSLAGTETVVVNNGGPRITTATTAQIGALGGSPGVTQQIKDTAISTAGNGTLTGAALVGGQIVRTGPSAAYTDTTDTAANIVTAIGQFVSGGTFFTRIKNATAFLQTISAGSGVTLPVTVIVGPWQEATYYGVVGGTSGSPTITFVHVSTTSIADAMGDTAPSITALSTVGAGTITAAMINGGIVSRTGSQSNTAFTDTTDTATAIVAGNPGLVGKVGASIAVDYQNTTNANATITGGTGVTVSGITVVPAGTTATFVITQTAANTLTMVGFRLTAAPSSVSGTFTANGATAVVVADTRVTANSTIAMSAKTIGGTPAGAPFLSAVTAGTGFSVKAAAGDTSVYNYLIIN